MAQVRTEMTCSSMGEINRALPRMGYLLRTSAVLIGLGLFISACATYEPVQKGYAGATAKLADSVVGDGERCASFFFLESYDGHDVQNALSVTERRNSGRGLAMTTEGYSRPVPAQEAILHHLKGRTHCAAPIIEVGHTVYMLEGDVKFAPERDGQYVIKGEPLGMQAAD